MMRRPKAVYVAYRRPDLESVDRLVTALEEELGAPPDYYGGWFFVDRVLDGGGGIDAGGAWLHTLTEAHRDAACVMGIMSKETMPNTPADFLEHAIYIDELRRAQKWGRLKPLILGTEPFDGPLGFDVSQAVFWAGHDTQAVCDIARTIREATREKIPEAEGTRSRRARWLSARRRDHVPDQMVAIDCVDVPLILRHVVDEVTGTNAFVSTAPIRVGGTETLDEQTVVRVICEAKQNGIPLSLLWINEVLDMIVAPIDAPRDWRNPFDLALDLTGPPLWALDEDDQIVVAISPRGTRVADPGRAALWITLRD